MPIQKKASGAAKEAPAKEYNVKVLKVRQFESENTTIAFDMEVNGITIYSCWYREYINKNGELAEMIDFPSQKAKDGKYYHHCYFKISDELKKEIIDQIGSLL